MKTVQEGKWWNYFVNFCDNTRLASGIEEKFISQLFESWEEEGKLLPYVLGTEYAKLIEGRILESEEHKENAEKPLTEYDYIKLTLRKAIMWGKENQIYVNKIGAFLTSPYCVFKALRGEYYKPLFMFSAPFIEKYGELSEEDILKKNSIRAFHPEIYDLIRHSLDDQFVE